MKFELFRQIFEKYPNVNFHENSSSDSRVVPCGRMDVRTDGRTDGQTDRQSDMTKVTVAFRNFANGSKMSGNVHCWT